VYDKTAVLFCKGTPLQSDKVPKTFTVEPMVVDED